ncbi:MAG: glycosyltransferase family 4 protein [Acidobacteria bacterium]|nr:glycosyltransferase family 4 protein [Acidobacteriota bacterium]
MDVLRVALDAKQMMGRPTGVGRVIGGVIAGLSRLALPGIETRLLSPREGARTLPWIELGLPWRARGSDVLHCPFYYRPLVAPCPTVVMIHDVLPVTHPEWFPRRGRHPFAELMLWSARHAAAVVTPSEAVLAELVRLAGPFGQRARVIAHGVDRERFRPLPGDHASPVLDRLGIQAPYLLTVGSLHPRRGIDTALEALGLLLEGRPELMLVIVGKEEHRWGSVPERVGERVVFTGYLPDVDLPLLMNGAEVMLSLSRGEGFDLPLLEALACGTPVVASDIDVHREHFEAWARLVPPDDAEAVASAVEDVLRRPPDRRLREEHAAIIHERFRWEDSARAHVEVWRRAAGERR